MVDIDFSLIPGRIYQTSKNFVLKKKQHNIHDRNLSVPIFEVGEARLNLRFG